MFTVSPGRECWNGRVCLFFLEDFVKIVSNRAELLLLRTDNGIRVAVVRKTRE